MRLRKIVIAVGLLALAYAGVKWYLDMPLVCRAMLTSAPMM